MKKKILGILIAMATCLTLVGQESGKTIPPPAAQETLAKVIHLRYVDFGAIAQAAAIYDVNVRPFGRDVAVSGPAEKVLQFEKSVKEIDSSGGSSPSRTSSVELSFYMLEPVEQNAGAKPGPELDGVVQQLKLLFPRSEYRLADTIFLRASEGREAYTTGHLSRGGTTPDVDSGQFSLRLRGIHFYADAKGKSIHIEGVEFVLRELVHVPAGSGFNTYEVSIKTDLDFRDGQKIVVGKANSQTVAGVDRPLFLVLSAKVVD